MYYVIIKAYCTYLYNITNYIITVLFSGTGDKKKPEAVKRCKTTDTGPHKTGNYDSWCESNCRLGNCPPAFCKCV